MSRYVIAGGEEGKNVRHFCRGVSTMQRITTAVISENLANEDEVKDVIDGLNTAAEDSNILISGPRVFQVWGTRDPG